MRGAACAFAAKKVAGGTGEGLPVMDCSNPVLSAPVGDGGCTSSVLSPSCGVTLSAAMNVTGDPAGVTDLTTGASTGACTDVAAAADAAAAAATRDTGELGGTGVACAPAAAAFAAAAARVRVGEMATREGSVG